MEEMDKRLSNLEAVRDTAEELLGQAGMDDETAQGDLNLLNLQRDHCSKKYIPLLQYVTCFVL